MAGEPILVVDSSVANLKLFEVLLGGAGYDVRTAADAPEALEVLLELTPRLILMDTELPGMDGLALVRRLRSEPRTQHLTILALTRDAAADTERLAMEAGCSGCVAKPVDLLGLVETVARHVRGAPGTR